MKEKAFDSAFIFPPRSDCVQSQPVSVMGTLILTSSRTSGFDGFARLVAPQEIDQRHKNRQAVVTEADDPVLQDASGVGGRLLPLALLARCSPVPVTEGAAVRDAQLGGPADLDFEPRNGGPQVGDSFVADRGSLGCDKMWSRLSRAILLQTFVAPGPFGSDDQPASARLVPSRSRPSGRWRGGAGLNLGFQAFVISPGGPNFAHAVKPLESRPRRGARGCRNGSRARRRPGPPRRDGPSRVSSSSATSAASTAADRLWPPPRRRSLRECRRPGRPPRDSPGWRRPESGEPPEPGPPTASPRRLRARQRPDFPEPRATSFRATLGRRPRSAGAVRRIARSSGWTGGNCRTDGGRSSKGGAKRLGRTNMQDSLRQGRLRIRRAGS